MFRIFYTIRAVYRLKVDKHRWSIRVFLCLHFYIYLVGIWKASSEFFIKKDMKYYSAYAISKGKIGKERSSYLCVLDLS